MKIRLFLILLILAFSGTSLCFADGDLIVNGNLGIGTSSPAQKLHVIGKIQINSDSGWIFRVVNEGTGLGSGLLGFGNAAGNNGIGFRQTSAGDLAFDFYSSGWFEAFRVLRSSGNVGIGTTNPGSYRLYVSGTSYSTGGWQSSDLRFKENIRPVESPLAKVMELNGVSFDWKTSEFKDKGFPAGRHYGVIAQEIEKVLPEVVSEGPEGEKSVAYTEIIPVLIEAIKVQQKEIEELKAEISSLKKK